MDQRGQGFWQCLGKTPHESKRDAYKAIENRQRMGNLTRRKNPVAPYRCGECGKWHCGEAAGLPRVRR